MTLTSNAYIFYFGIPIVIFLIMTTIALRNNSRALEHRLLAGTFIIYSIIFSAEWYRHLTSLEKSPFLNVWIIGTLMILAIILTMHVCAVLYERHTRRKWPFPKWLLYLGLVIHVLVGLSDAAPVAADFVQQGIWILRDAPLYSTWIFTFLFISMGLNIYVCYDGYRHSHKMQKSKKLFLFIACIIPVNGFLYMLVTLLTPDRFLPSISSLYIMVTLSLFILVGMQRFHLFPKYAQRYITMFNKSPISKFVLDESFNIIEVNEQTKRYFKMNFVGMNLMELMKKHENITVVRPILEALKKHKEIDNQKLALRHFTTGEPIHLVIHANEIEENGEVFYYVMFRDRTLEVDQEDKIRQLAYFDSLTSLPNRVSFIEESKKLFKQEPDGALLLIDLNDFKHVNDHYGHAAGDLMLQAVGKVLARVARNVHLPARLGGDEFVMYVRINRLSTTFDQFVHDLRGQLQNEPISFEGSPLQIKPSIGYAIKTSKMTISDMIHEADQKMYEDKQRIKKGHPKNSATTLD